MRATGNVVFIRFVSVHSVFYEGSLFRLRWRATVAAPPPMPQRNITGERRIQSNVGGSKRFHCLLKFPLHWLRIFQDAAVITTLELEVTWWWRVQDILMDTILISTAYGHWWQKSTTGSLWRWILWILKLDPAVLIASKSTMEVRDSNMRLPLLFAIHNLNWYRHFCYQSLYISYFDMA